MDDLRFLSQVADELGSVHPPTAPTTDTSYYGEEPESLTLGQTQVMPLADAGDPEDYRHLIIALTHSLHHSESLSTPLILKYYTERKNKRKPSPKWLFPRSPDDTTSLITGPIEPLLFTDNAITPLSMNRHLQEALTDQLLLKSKKISSERAEALAQKIMIQLEMILENVISRNRIIRRLYGHTLNHNRLPLRELLINHNSVLSVASTNVDIDGDAIKSKLDYLISFNNKNKE